MKRLFKLVAIAVGISTLSSVPSASAADLIAGWDSFRFNPNGAGLRPPTVDDGVTTGDMVYFGFNVDPDQRVSLDGTWGSLETDPPANQAAPEPGSSTNSARLVNGSSGAIEFTVTDTGGAARDLTGFHFDTMTFRPNSARAWELIVLSGDITNGSVASGEVPRGTGGVQDWFDYDIDLTGLADHELDANGSVTFRLEMASLADPEGQPYGGHHQGLDNVAISTGLFDFSEPGDFNADKLFNLADYTVWRDNLGATEDGSALNGNGNGGTVDETDYDLWKTNFGSPAGNASLSISNVPEPSAALLGLTGAALGLAVRRQQRNPA